ncbi:MAG: 6-bladed beta-propeller [Rikenellaceae bacterium]|jgi:hypothetical protein|nr:6-bladed beta-propeller [Rikenellaceae bacterium]
MKKLALFLLAVALTGCGAGNRKSDAEVETKAVEESDFFVFDLEAGIEQEPKATTLNELIDSISYIPLETHSDALLSDRFLSFAKMGNDLFVVDGLPNKTYLYQFDSLGRFVKPILRPGRGPNEIVMLGGWYVHPRLKQLNFVDLASKMIIVQTDSGEKSTVEISRSQDFEWVPLNDSTFVTSQRLNSLPIPNTYLYFFDRAGHLVHAIERNDELLSHNSNRSEQGQAPPYEAYGLFSDYKGDAIFQDIFNDTLYRIKNYREITPHLVFKRGALSPRPEDKQNAERKKKQVHFVDIKESRDYVFLRYLHDDKRSLEVWSKRDGSLMLRGSHSIPFMLPDGTLAKQLHISYVEEDTIYGVLGALDASKFLPGIAEDDNPVVVVMKLKK